MSAAWAHLALRLTARVGELEAQLSEREDALAGLLPYAQSKAEELLELADRTGNEQVHLDANMAVTAIETARELLRTCAEPSPVSDRSYRRVELRTAGDGSAEGDA
jgi:hypothetical protein